MIEIPELPAGADNLAAALAYARAGLYVVPSRRGAKNPGSRVGDRWQDKSSRDPEQIEEWFADSDDDVAIHAGRSGLVIADVDVPDNVPEPLAGYLPGAPFHASRPAIPGYGHYVFAQPEGRMLGNALGKLAAGRDGGKWGQIRGRNGVIMAFPSLHTDGGEYRWLRTGPVPVMPDDVVDLLTAGLMAHEDADVEVATDAEVEAFVVEHSTATRLGALDAKIKGFAEVLAAGRGRHDSLSAFLVGAMEEARAGLYGAQAAIDELWPLFREAAGVGPKRRSESRARAEFASLLAWAVARAMIADLDAVRARVKDALGVDGEAAFADILRNAAASKPKAEPGLRLRWALDLAPAAPMKWLALGRIPLSAVTLLTGDEGIGKSLLWVWIAAAVSTGRAVPEFGIPAREPRHVVIIVTEDSWSGVARARLELAGADMAYIRLLCEDDNGTGSPSFPRDIGLVRSAEPPPYLVVVDTWADALDAGLTVKDAQHARQALHPWSETADKLGAAVILVTHTNRGTGTSIRERYAMTSELRKKARMSLFAQQDEDGNLVVGPDKSNLSGKINASVFAVDQVQMFAETDDGDGTVGKVVYIGDAGRTAAELLADLAGADRETDGSKGMAQVTLAALLADGKDHDRAEVIEKMAAAGIPESTAKRAAGRLGVVKDRKGFPATSTWRLPVVPPVVPSADAGTTGTTGDVGTTASSDQPPVVPPVVPVVPVVPPRTDGTTAGTTGMGKGNQAAPSKDTPDCPIALSPADDVNQATRQSGEPLRDAAQSTGAVENSENRKGFPATSTWRLPSQSTSELSVPTELTELTEPTEPTESSVSPPVSPVSSVSSVQTDGLTGELTGLPVVPPDTPDCPIALSPADDVNHKVTKLSRGLFVQVGVRSVRSVRNEDQDSPADTDAETETDSPDTSDSSLHSNDTADNSTVENSENLDPNGWPLCAGGCGLGVNPAITDSDRHGFCS